MLIRIDQSPSIYARVNLSLNIIEIQVYLELVDSDILLCRKQFRLIPHRAVTAAEILGATAVTGRKLEDGRLAVRTKLLMMKKHRAKIPIDS